MVFFKFNSLSGRLAASTPSQAYMPQGIQSATPEVPSFQFDSATTQRVPVAPTIASEAGAVESAKGVIPRDPGYQNIVKLQKEWAVEDGLMVWQKRGMRDRLPLWATFGIMGVGLALCFRNLYKMSYPQPPSED